MNPTTELPSLREVIRQHGLDARRSLGQHFLLDLNLTARIARAANVAKGQTVYEVGPGPGGLTRALLEAGARVIAVETDSRCVAALDMLSASFPGKLTIVEGDALAVDESALFAEGATIVANLPYNVSTTLLVKWLTAGPSPFTDMTLMFQKEVADRILASPGNKTYGRLSVLAQWRCEVRRAFDIPARAFLPPPKVDSTVVRLTPSATPIDVKASDLERVTAAAFGQRRKMLRSSLKQIVDDPGGILRALGVEETKRAEDLSVEQFCALARALGGSGSV
ncbi:MAG: 16S rRNA (adenine(1518)-N(6)/adenine(1519)-N(6))-dimethyltransferase RsmA [Alphaproteobacteria bacterium]